METIECRREQQLPCALIDCVTEAVSSTFASIYGREPQKKDNGSAEVVGDGVLGIISLVGALQCSIVLGLPRETAKAVTAKFAGFEIDYEGPDMGDVVGELANVVAGDAAGRLESRGIKADLSLPTVARGNDVEMIQQGNTTSRLVHFECTGGSFWVKISAETQAGARN
ncbi:MAG TPA: chemotaxis protein CheX [bacterium]|nr:chemotaxis protein CheX [bacterium]